MAIYTQADRPLRIQTKLGTDVLLLASFEGFEAVSKPFKFDVKLLSLKPDIDPKELLGTPAVISYHLPIEDGAEMRHIHGIFGRFTQVGRVGELTSYEGSIVPWLHYLSIAQDNRIFQKLSVIEIVKKVFEKGGFSQSEHFEFRTSGSYQPKEYVVQYKESNLNFIGRWLEREGLFYYFEHEEDKHVMVVTDDISTAPPCPPPDVAIMSAKPKPGQEAVMSVGWEQSVYIGKITLKDYDYLQPSLSLLAEIEGEGSEEIYEYPGGFTTQDEGERYARLMLEAEEAQRHVIHGNSTVRTFVAGHSFELREHPRPDANGRYVLLEVKHEGVNGDYRSGSASEYDYRNSFLAIPENVKYRPRMLTKKPLVRGTQTAVVVGPAGEEIWPDQHGRVLIQFHWDRLGNRDEKSSCWVRVSQPWAGKGWGAVFLPRIGQEVIVDFLEGDPDQPIIIGRVYNAQQPPPYELPAHKTQSGIKSRSSPNGSVTNFNEIRFEDLKGSEHFFMQAERTMTIRVKGSESHSVGGSQSVTVGGDHNTKIKKNTNFEVTEGGYNISVKQKQMFIDVPNAQFHVHGKKVWHIADEEFTADVAGNTIRMDTSSVSITGKSKVTLTCGGSKIELTPGGITISSSGPVDVKGLPIKLNS